MSNNTALLIIDAQVNMFAKASSVYKGEEILRTISRLIAQARSAHLPIVYVQNNGSEGDPDMPGTPGWQIHPAIKPEIEDIVIEKHTPDSFHKTNLQNELEARYIRYLIIAGMQTEICIDATCRRAHELGYEVTLVKDAHSTFDGDGVPAGQIISQYNDALQAVVKLEAASNITLRLANFNKSSRGSVVLGKIMVDDFVKTKVLPEFQPIVAMIRELMKDSAPNVQEVISYGIPAYKGKRVLAVISPTKKDITFSFSHGAEFEDKYNLLQGVGKVSKHVKIKNLADVNRDALRYYIKQALEFDEK